MANACLFLMEHYDGGEIVNIGTAEDITIKELAELIAEESGYKGKIEFDTSKPDGTPRKLLDVGRINKLGWKAKTGLREGIRQRTETYRWEIGRSAKGEKTRRSKPL